MRKDTNIVATDNGNKNGSRSRMGERFLRAAVSFSLIVSLCVALPSSFLKVEAAANNQAVASENQTGIEAAPTGEASGAAAGEAPGAAAEENNTSPEKPALVNADGTYVWTGEGISVIHAPDIGCDKYAVMLKKDGASINEDDYGAKGIAADAETGMVSVTEIGKYEAVFNLQDGFTWRDSGTESDTAPVFFAFEVVEESAVCPDSATRGYGVSEQEPYADSATDTATALDNSTDESDSHTVTLAKIAFDEQYEGDRGYTESSLSSSLLSVDEQKVGSWGVNKSCTAKKGQRVTGSLNFYNTGDGTLGKYKLAYVTVEWEENGSLHTDRVDGENINIASLEGPGSAYPLYHFSFDMPDGDVTVTPHLELLKVSPYVCMNKYQVVSQEGTEIGYHVSICTAGDDGSLQVLEEADVTAQVEDGKLKKEVPLNNFLVTYGDKYTVLIEAKAGSDAAGLATMLSNGYYFRAEYNDKYSKDNVAAYDITVTSSAFRRTQTSDEVKVPIDITPTCKNRCHIEYVNKEKAGGSLLFFYDFDIFSHSWLQEVDRVSTSCERYIPSSYVKIYVKPDEGYYLKSFTYADSQDGENQIVPFTYEDFNKKILDGGNYAVYNLYPPSSPEGLWIFPEFEKISTFVEENKEYFTYDEENKTVEIKDAAGLERLSELTNQGVQESGGGFALNRFCGITFELCDDISLDACGNWRPISWNNHFYGNFDGGGHTISAMHIDNSQPYEDGAWPSYIGLFGNTYGGYIRNLTVEGQIDLGAGTVSVGGIAANAWELTDCTSRVDITANCVVDYVGGIAASAHSLSACKNYGDIKLDAHLAGFDPDSYPSYYPDRPPLGAMSDNKSFHPVKSVGGIAATVQSQEEVVAVKNCGNYGSIDITAPWTHTGNSQSSGGMYEWAWTCAGGIVGKCHTTNSFGNPEGDPREIGGNVQISGCVNRGAMTGDFKWGGGILGISCGETTVIENCVNAALIYEDAKGIDNSGTGAQDIRLGGIVGTTAKSTKGGKEYLLELSNCYNACTVTCTRKSGSVYVGELHGNGESQLAFDQPGVTTVENCHYGTIPESGIPEYLKVKDVDGNAVFSDAFPPLIHVWELELAGADASLHTLTVEAEQGKCVESTSYTVSLYKDAAYSEAAGEPVSKQFGEKAEFAGLASGVYYYAVTSDGCVAERGAVPLIIVDNSASVSMTGAVKVQFEVSPAEAEFALKYNSKEVSCTDKQTADGHAVYTYDGLYAVSPYRYDAKAGGYGSVSKAMLTGEEGSVVRVELEAKSTVSAGAVTRGEDYHITQGGVYSLPPGKYGSKIYIDTSQDVTLVGEGVASSGKCSAVSIICRETGGVRLTLQDVYLCGPDSRANLIDFKGMGNILNFAGTNVLEQETGATGYAMIHVPKDSELSISGGTAYMYKSEQGAGIGGNGDGVDGSLAGEVNGKICFEGATIFMKGTKQGAVIGSGANSYSDNGGMGKTITIRNSTLNLIANARGAAIGGGAGSSGGYGGDVEIENSTVNINVNYTGAAIGGAGNASGNDKSEGGYVSVKNSSLRCYISSNAECWGVADAMEAAGSADGIVSTNAINNILSFGNGKCRLFDVSGVLQQAGTDTFEVYGRTADEEEVLLYSGGPQYRYVSEVDSEFSSTDTLANWVEVSDDYLLYLDDGYEEYVVVAGGSTYLLNEDTENVAKYGTIQPTARYSMDRTESYQDFWHQSKLTVVQEATCTQSGKRTFVCTVCGAQDEENSKEIPALGHSYGTPSYTWEQSGNGYTCTARKECSRCEDEVEETVSAKVTTIPATDLAPGSITYTAEFNDGSFEAQTQEITLPQLPAEDQPGQDTPGQDQPGQDQPGQSTPGQSTPGQSTPGQDQPGQDTPGQSTPGQSTPGQSAAAEAETTVQSNTANAAAMNKKVQAAWSGNGLKITWGSVKGVSGYDIYLVKCNGKGMQRENIVKTVKKASTTSVTIKKINGKKLNKKSCYKAMVRAYRMVNGKKKYAGTSLQLHIAGKNNKKYTDVKSVTLTSKQKITLKAKKTSKIRANVVKTDSKRKLLNHIKKLRYFSTNTKVAAVSQSGKITAKKKGKCLVYAVAENGVKKAVTVTVK